MATIEQRLRILVNTDPQRRCYDGVHFSSEWQWTRWSILESNLKEDGIEDRLEFWRNLNKIAVYGRGEEARREFRIATEER